MQYSKYSRIGSIALKSNDLYWQVLYTEPALAHSWLSWRPWIKPDTRWPVMNLQRSEFLLLLSITAPVSGTLSYALTNMSSNDRHCWVCFATEKEDRAAEWVSPCRCKGCTKWIHQSCLQRWLDEKQKGNSGGAVSCPQCGTEYHIVFPKMGKYLHFTYFEARLTDTLFLFGVWIFLTFLMNILNAPNHCTFMKYSR